MTAWDLAMLVDRRDILVAIERFHVGVVVADNKLIAMYNLARKFLPHRL